MKLACPLVPALLSLAMPALAGVRYVDSTLTTGANDGSSWANAYRGPLGLQAAIGPAVPGDRIWARAGRYVPAAVGHPELSFTLKYGVGIYGGFAGNETQLDQRDPFANLTVLSGDLMNNDGAGGYTDNSRHIIFCDGAAAGGLLDGFTLSSGRAPSLSLQDGRGAAIYFQMAGTPTIRNCILSDNVAAFDGGAVYAWACSPRFEHTNFLANHAHYGGALMFENCSDVQFESCELRDNVASRAGGAMVLYTPNLGFRNCLVCNNRSIGTGIYAGAGGMETYGSSTTMLNCSVAGNTSIAAATAGLMATGSLTLLANCIVHSNVGVGGGGQTLDNLTGASAHHSCIGGGMPGLGNISADPLFLDLLGGNVRLAPTSPCADAGDSSAFPHDGSGDFAGQPRFQDATLVPDTGTGGFPVIDIGAFEIRNELYTTFCAGDGSLATACPCGNTGAIGRGCRSSDVFSPGAFLVASGSSTPDSVVLAGSDIFPDGTCVFLQGDQQLVGGVVFGDGVRCVGGHLLRLYVKSVSGGSVSAPGASDPSLSARSAALGDPIQPGELRSYQIYYRDPDPTFCPAPQGSTWNVSSGVIVNW
jgi:hypothetical protein